MLHPRHAVDIRADALKMAIRKATTGCYSCAQSYLALARKHGATEEEMYQAIDAAGESGEKGVSRRALLKIAGVVLAGGTLSAGELLPHRAEAASYYWGTDSNTGTSPEMPQNFYVGRFGYGTTGSSFFFNTGAALSAGKSSTYMYWGLEGPGLAPSGATPYGWGWLQASNALDQWYNNPNSGFVGGHTIFADIESGFGGWTTGSSAYSDNQQVARGFLDCIASAFTPVTPFHPGIYIFPGDWAGYFGTDFRPKTPFVLWVAGCYACSNIICAPCDDSCWTTLLTVESLLPTVMSTILGGAQAVLWQYWLDPPCGCGDFDVSLQNPADGFRPVSSETTYYSVC